jgi:hypothetical protein
MNGVLPFHTRAHGFMIRNENIKLPKSYRLMKIGAGHNLYLRSNQCPL